MSLGGGLWNAVGAIVPPVAPADVKDVQRSKPGKPAQPPAAGIGGQASATAVLERPRPLAADNKPHPALVAIGFTGGSKDFYFKVQQATDAYAAVNGVKPSPGLVLDVVRSPVDPSQYQSLFQATPTTHLGAQAAFTAATLGPDAAAAKNEDEIMSGLAQAWATGKASGSPYEQQHRPLDFLNQHLAEIQRLQRNPGFVQRLHDQITMMQVTGQIAPITATRIFAAVGGLKADMKEPTALGWRDPAGLIGDFLGFVGRSYMQTLGGIVLGLPVLAYTEGRAVGKAAQQVAAGHPGAAAASFGNTQYELGKTIVQGVQRDFSDPLNNFGYLTLDVFAGLSLGAGAAARVGAAGAAAREAGTVAALRSLVVKPPPRIVTIHYGPTEVSQILSDNPLVASVQKSVISVRQAALDKRINGQPEAVTAAEHDAILRSDQLIRDAGNAQEMAQRGLLGVFPWSPTSMEAKIGRLARAELRTQQKLYNILRIPVEQAVHRQVRWNVFKGQVKPEVWGKLTVGEQSAIWAESFDITGSPAEKLAVLRDYGVKQITEAQSEYARLGSDRAAERLADTTRLWGGQIAQIDLGLKAMANPTPRYFEALKAVRDASLEMEWQKVNRMSFPAERASGALAKKGAEVRGEPIPAGTPADVIALARQNPESFYLGDIPLEAPRARSPVLRTSGAGLYGNSPPAELMSLKHANQFELLRAGNFQMDTAGLTLRNYANTTRALVLSEEYNRLWAMSRADKPVGRGSGDWAPIRDTNSIPDWFRRVVNQNPDPTTVLTPEDIGVDFNSLSIDDIHTLREHLMPRQSDLPPEQTAGVRWYDTRTSTYVPRDLTTKRYAQNIRFAFDLINEPLRWTRLFARIAYALNMLGNEGMALMETIIRNPDTLVKAFHADRLYGEYTARGLDEMGGQTRSFSYAEAAIWKPTQSIARAWSAITDRTHRRAIGIYWLERQGVKPKEFEALFRNAARGDKQAFQTVHQASLRTEKALGQMDNLVPIERDWLRHIFFVYPWVSRSAILSLRQLVEHPIKEDLLAQVGHQEMIDNPWYALLPKWMRLAGVMITGTDDKGRPTMTNWSSINTPTTLSQMLGTAGDPQMFRTLLGPGADIAIGIVSGVDKYGNSYTTPVVDPFMDQIAGLPQFSADTRAHQQLAPLKPITDMTNDRALVEQVTATQSGPYKRTLYIPHGLWDALWPLAIGGLLERTGDPIVMLAQQRRDATPAERDKIDRKLIVEMQQRQADLLGVPLPQDVVKAVRVADDITKVKREWAKTNRAAAYPREEARLVMMALQAKGLIPEGDLPKLNNRLDNEITTGQIDSFTTGLLGTYGYGNELKAWHEKVKAVASYMAPGRLEHLNKSLDLLGVQTVRTDPRASKTALRDYGRAMLAYTEDRKRLEKQVANKNATAVEKADAELRLQAFDEEHDKTLSFDGASFTSPTRMRVAQADTAKVSAELRQAATGDWRTLTTVQKQMLGEKTTGQVTEGYRVLDSWMKQAADRQPIGEPLPSNTEDHYARTIGKKVPGFYKDYLKGKEILAVRLTTALKAVTEPNRGQFDEILRYAAQRWSSLLGAGWSKTDAGVQWRRNDVPNLLEKLKAYPDLVSEINAWGGRPFLEGLVSANG